MNLVVKKRIILGDSMLKDIEQQKLRKGLNNKERIFVKHFSGATVEDMKNYVIQSKKYENDLGDQAATEIAREIVELAIDMKTEINDTIISGIIPRRDNLNEKAMEDKLLQNTCGSYNFYFIDNTNVNKKSDLNMGGLHLNYKGTYVLGGNLVKAIRL